MHLLLTFLSSLPPSHVLQAPDTFKASQMGSTADPICAITAHQHQLLVARSSGVVHGFGLPGLNPDGQYLLRCRPQRLALNCDGSRLAVIDFNGVLSFMDVTASGTGKMKGEHLAYERKVNTAATCKGHLTRRGHAVLPARSRHQDVMIFYHCASDTGHRGLQKTEC